jgi:hypothetical protein
LGTAATLLPANVDIGLSTTAISDDGTGYTEPVGGSYARVTKANTNANWAVATAGSKINASDIVFPTATGDWGTVTHWFISDTALTQIYAYGVLDDGLGVPLPRAVLNGDEFKFLAGDLRIDLD